MTIDRNIVLRKVIPAFETPVQSGNTKTARIIKTCE